MRLKRYKFLSMFIFFFFLIGMCYADSKLDNISLLGKVIYLDAGHGGMDPGAVYKNINEADINLKFTMILKEKLEEKGAIVLLTRQGDYDLAINSYNHKRSDINNRIFIINESNADIYISIHMNAEETGLWYGSQVFFDDVNKNNEKIARIIQDRLNTKRDIYERDNIKLCRMIRVPGVLIELGFITNYSDRKRIQTDEYKDELATLIISGIIDYFN